MNDVESLLRAGASGVPHFEVDERSVEAAMCGARQRRVRRTAAAAAGTTACLLLLVGAASLLLAGEQRDTDALRIANAPSAQPSAPGTAYEWVTPGYLPDGAALIDRTTGPNGTVGSQYAFPGSEASVHTIELTFVPGATDLPPIPADPDYFTTSTVAISGHDASLAEPKDDGGGVRRVDWVDSHGYHVVMAGLVPAGSDGWAPMPAEELVRIAESLYQPRRQQTRSPTGGIQVEVVSARVAAADVLDVGLAACRAAGLVVTAHETSAEVRLTASAETTFDAGTGPDCMDRTQVWLASPLAGRAVVDASGAVLLARSDGGASEPPGGVDLRDGDLGVVPPDFFEQRPLKVGGPVPQPRTK